MKKNSFGKRLKYWFDNQMSKGSAMMVAMLAIAAILPVILLAAIIGICGFSEDGTAFSVFWDILASTINAWMPYSEDGGIGYILLTAVAAIIGLFFTSFLIGIISSAVEDRLSGLRKGNSVILEEGHIVVLGYREGEYELIRQLILAAEDDHRIIVVADDGEKDEMEEQIYDNVEIPKNVRVICRHADPTVPSELSCCSLEDASYVIVSPGNDRKTVKTLLAVSRAMEECERKPRIAATIADPSYQLPESYRKKHRIQILKTNDAIARIIAHSCTQPGLSEAFKEVFNFSGNEFYLAAGEKAEGKSFGELLLCTDGAVPVGIFREGSMLLNPDWEETVKAEDRLLIFAESAGNMVLNASDSALKMKKPEKKGTSGERKERLVLIGYNRSFRTVVKELPDDLGEVILAGIRDDQLELAEEVLKEKEVSITVSNLRPDREEELEKLISGAAHVVLLNDREQEADEADLSMTLLILKLRDIKERTGAAFTITAEMRREDNCSLLTNSDFTDFIVSSDLSSMILVQIAEVPELYDAFHELLSNTGNEFVMRSANELGLAGKTMTTKEMRAFLMESGSLFFGCLKNEGDGVALKLNPGLSEELKLTEDTRLVVIEEQ